MTHTTTPLLDRSTQERPDTTIGPDADDRYLDTVRTLRAHAKALRATLGTAEQATDGPARTAALHDLHRQLRDMAGHANHALGGWAAPPEPA